MKKYLPYLNILGAAACWGCIGLFNRFLMRAGMGAANIFSRCASGAYSM